MNEKEILEISFPFPPSIMRALSNLGKYEGIFEGEEINVSLEKPLEGEQLKIMNAMLDLLEKKQREKNG